MLKGSWGISWDFPWFNLETSKMDTVKGTKTSSAAYLQCTRLEIDNEPSITVRQFNFTVTFILYAKG